MTLRNHIGGVAPKEKHRIGSNKAVKQSNRSVPKTCNKDYILPDCLRALYGTLNYTVQVPEENSIGLTNYLGEISNRSDVKTFLEGLRSDAVVAADTFKVVSINGGSESTHSITKGKNKEGNLDAQTILGISHPVPLTTFNVGGKPPFEPDKATRELLPLVIASYPLSCQGVPIFISPFPNSTISASTGC